MRLTPFSDPLGRISEKPTDQEYGISDNPNLFTGEYCFLAKLLKRFGTQEELLCSSTFSFAIVEPGLYTRHPQFLRDKFNIPFNVISHDEYLGVLLLAHCLGISEAIAKDIVAYGKAYGWQYNDLYPRANFFAALKANPIDTIKKLIAYKKDYKANPQDTNSIDLRHDGNISSLTFIRQPRDRALYKLIAREKISLIESLWLSFAHVYTTRRDLEDGSRGGTMLLAWFRMMLLEAELGKNLPFLVKLSHKLFSKILTRKYGRSYPFVLANRYFDRVSAENNQKHPIIYMIKDLLWEVE